VRVSTMTTPRLMRAKLQEMFPGERGSWEDWEPAVARQMFTQVSRDLKAGVRADYNTHTGLLGLYRAAGGKPSASMIATAEAQDAKVAGHRLLKELEDLWNVFARAPADGAGSVAAGAGGPTIGEQMPYSLSYREFYDSISSRYMPCYACAKFDEAMAVLDPDKHGVIRFAELKIRGRWVLLNYGDRDIDGRERPIETVEQLLDAIFELAIVHEVLTARKNNRLAKLWRKLLMIMINHGQAVVALERRRSTRSMISEGSLVESEAARTPGRSFVGTPARSRTVSADVIAVAAPELPGALGAP